MIINLIKSVWASCDTLICKGAESCNLSVCSSCDFCQGKGIHNPVVGVFGSGEGADILARLIANFLKITFSVAGLVLLAMLLWGGIQWMTAGGDKEQMTKAQGKITSALIGFAIFMSIFAIINFIAPALGLEFLQILKIEWPTP